MSASSALAAANARLLRLRAAQCTAASVQPVNRPAAAATLPWEAPEPALTAQVLALPSHLGWGSQAASHHIREARRRQQKRAAAANCHFRPPTQQVTANTPAQPEPETPLADHIAVLPDLALAMLKGGLASQGRLWYLLRHLDRAGRGWHEQGKLRKQLLSSDLRFCGRRQLANLIKEGEGIFWRSGRGRLWLYSAGKTSANLGVEGANYRPVAVPLKAFLGKVGLVRAHFYATYHSARAKGHRPGMPVARETIQAITGVDPYAQRSYEKRLGLDVRANIAIGEEIVEGPAGQALAQERAWRHGHALFTLTDYKGKQGPKGRRYHAWQLPNSYGALHAAEPRGRRRRLNRQLIDLQKKGAGNDRVGRRYFANGKRMENAKGLQHVDRYCANAYPRTTGRYAGGTTWSVWSEGLI